MAGCLIAYGAVLGKVSPVQLMVLTLFGVTLFAIEEYIILDLIHVSGNSGNIMLIMQIPNALAYICWKLRSHQLICQCIYLLTHVELSLD